MITCKNEENIIAAPYVVYVKAMNHGSISNEQRKKEE